jgi:isopentenyldiphosphate isomerase
MKNKEIIELIIFSLEQLNKKDINKLLPIFFKEKKIGWINTKNFDLIKKAFEIKDLDKLNLEYLFNSDSEWQDKILDLSLKSNLINQNYNEHCPIFFYEALNPKTNFSDTEIFGEGKLFEINRGLMSFFGFPTYGVHCNGWIIEDKKIYLFLAKRSKELITFPGLYDNLIGGGQPSDISLRDNLLKEGFEEVGLSKSFLFNAYFNTFTKYSHTYNGKLNSSVIATYDLELSKDFIFKSEDGEVEKVEKFEISEVFSLIKKKQLKPNCIIPIINFMLIKMPNFFNKNALLEIEKYLI